MDESIDTGDVLLQRAMPIEPGDTVHSLVLRSKVEVGRHLLLDAIAAIEAGRTRYGPAAGIPELRERVAARHHEQTGVPTAREGYEALLRQQ